MNVHTVSFSLSNVPKVEDPCFGEPLRYTNAAMMWVQCEIQAIENVKCITKRCAAKQIKWIRNRFLRNVIYLELVYLVTALIPSETACLANSQGTLQSGFPDW